MSRRRNLQISRSLSLPINAVTETFGILAKRGMGKTYLAGVMAEEMLAVGCPIVIFDPTDAWWGLRSSADGSREGFPIVVMGGDHADVPLEPTAGEMIADLVMRENISVILSMEHWKKAEMKRFVADFAERLYQKNREPRHLFMDEADLFAPQMIPKGHERMVGAIEDIVRRGRKKGLGCTMITQRSAVLNKNVLTQIEVLVSLRLTSPQDQKAIYAWVEKNADEDLCVQMMEDLPSLPKGTAYVWSPGWLDIFKKVQVREKHTFDSSKTPEVGKKIRPPKKLAKVDINRIKTQIEATIETAKKDDPRVLRQKIMELKQELAKKPAAQVVREPVVKTKVVRVEVPIIKKRQLQKLEKLLKRCEDLRERFGYAAQSFEVYTRDIWSDIAMLKEKAEEQASALAPAPQVAPPKAVAPPRPRPINDSGLTFTALPDDGVKLRRGEKKILTALAQFHPKDLTRDQLATLSGYPARGGSFPTYAGVLRRHGLAEKDGEHFRITDKGIRHIGEVPPISGTQELIAMWKSRLRAGEKTILDLLIEAYPGARSPQQIQTASGYDKKTTFDTYMGVLKRNGLVTVGRNSGLLVASDTLFPSV